MKSSNTSNKPKVKKRHRPTCKFCKTRFEASSAREAYCTEACRSAAKNARRRIDDTKRLIRASHSPFFYWLASECERAGSLCILTGHTLETLLDLHAVYKTSLKANEYGDKKDFEISHISPVKGTSTLGLLHAQNLVVAPVALNRAHGTKHYGHGLNIPRHTMLPKYAVHEGAKRSTTVDRVIAYLGKDVVAQLVIKAKIQPTERYKLLAWLRAHMPATDERLALLEGMSTKALKALKAEIEGMLPRDFKIKTSRHSSLLVLFSELERHISYRPELQAVADSVQRIIPAHLMNVRRWEGSLSDAGLQALFDVLHGKPVADVMPVLWDLLYDQRSQELVLPYTPIVFHRPEPNAAVQMPQLIAMLPTPTRIKSFADDLDSEQMAMPEGIPVLRHWTPDLPDERDPLPW